MDMRLVSFGSLCVLGLSLVCATPSRAGADIPTAPVVPGEILVGFAPTRTGLTAQSASINPVGQVAGFNSRLNAARVVLRPGLSMASAMAHMRAQPGVQYAEPNHILHICADPNDPDYKTLQYAPQIIQANLSWDIWKPRATILVAIVDTGIQSTHPDLQAIVCRDSNGAIVGWNTLNNTSNADDDGGHGTHCAGVALAHINDGTGPAGITGWNPNVAGSDTFVKLMPIKALDAAGNGTDASVAAGITWAADHGAQVISVSASSVSTSTTMANAIQYAWNKGSVIVAAAGNDASSALEYPAAYPNVLSVAATDSTDTLLFFSQYGSWIKCAAPGSNIYSTYISSSYTGMTGTSTAAPHVAAEAAAILSQNPTLTNAQVNALITSQVDPVLPYQGQSLGTSSGRINIYRALLAAGDGIPNLTTVSFNPATIPNAKSTTGTIQLGGPAPAGGIVVSLSSSDTTVATVPASVTVPAGANSVTFTATGKLVDANSQTTVTASDGVKTATAVLTVNGSVVSSISCSPISVASNGTFVGTVTLDAPAPTGGGIVTLSDDGGGLLSTPASVTVPAGAKSATFNGSAGIVTRRTSVTMSASLNGATASCTIMVNPLQVSTLTVSPTSVLGGNSATGTVGLSAAAPAGGMAVYLTSSLTSAATVPATVTVPAGATSATFTISTLSVTSSKSVTISAAAGGVVKSAALNVTSVLQSVTLSPTSVAGGLSSTGKVTLAVAAPAGGAVVNLSSNNAAAVPPASVTVAAGATSATFTIATSPVTSNVTATITASYSGAKATAKLTVKAPVVSKLVLNPTSLTGGASSTATVTLTGPAPAGGKVVTLSSNNASATVPSSITIPAGVTSATFAVTTTTVTAKISVTLSAVTGTTTKSAVLTINP